jgi:hypothetical protein
VLRLILGSATLDTVIVYDSRNLPDDPRDNGFVDAHRPDGRIARLREVDEAFALVDPDTEERFEMPQGGYLVWEDGAWRAIEREEFMDEAWDVSLGAPSTLEVDEAP